MYEFSEEGIALEYVFEEEIDTEGSQEIEEELEAEHPVNERVEETENDNNEDSIQPESLKEGWQNSVQGLRYYSASGEYLVGKYEVGGNWYYFDESGICKKNTWITDGDKKYYAMPDGSLRVGWLSFGSTYYYCGSDAAIVYGKQKIGNNWYYFDKNGVRKQSTWIEEGGKKYYAMPDGTLRVGWLSFGSTYYYCGSDGAIVTGIYTIDGVGYQFDEEGVRQNLKTGWHEEDDKKYYRSEERRVGKEC